MARLTVQAVKERAERMGLKVARYNVSVFKWWAIVKDGETVFKSPLIFELNDFLDKLEGAKK